METVIVQLKYENLLSNLNNRVENGDISSNTPLK
jgi:hypothetical protein